jgi:hypothetical protein
VALFGAPFGGHLKQVLAPALQKRTERGALWPVGTQVPPSFVCSRAADVQTGAMQRALLVLALHIGWSLQLVLRNGVSGDHGDLHLARPGEGPPAPGLAEYSWTLPSHSPAHSFWIPLLLPALLIGHQSQPSCICTWMWFQCTLLCAQGLSQHLPLPGK